MCCGHQPHRVEVVRQDRVLVEERVVRLDAARQHDRLGRRQPAVDLDAEVDVVADRLAVLAHRLDRVADLGGVGLEVGTVARLVEERRQVADGREARLLGVDAALHQLLASCRRRRGSRPAPCRGTLPPSRLVDRHAEVLAGDVPERDVDGAERAHDRRARGSGSSGTCTASGARSGAGPRRPDSARTSRRRPRTPPGSPRRQFHQFPRSPHRSLISAYIYRSRK